MEISENREAGSLLSFKKICRDHGLSITPQRVAIYVELTHSKGHPSAMMIYKKVSREYPNISLDTVNRTLLTFHEIGLIKVLESTGEPKRFDPNLKPHHHLRCVKCGKIIDFVSDLYDSLAIPEELLKKFVILEKRVHLEGYCQDCKEFEGVYS